MDKQNASLRWLREHKFEVHSLAFGLMIISAALLYAAAETDATGWIWFLLGLFITGNLLALAVR